MKKITFIIIIFSIVSTISAVYASTPAEIERKIMRERQYKRHSLHYARAFIGDLAPTYYPDKEQELIIARAELGDIKSYIEFKALAYGPKRADLDKDVQILFDACERKEDMLARERYFDANYFYNFAYTIIKNKINNIDKYLRNLYEKKLK